MIVGMSVASAAEPNALLNAPEKLQATTSVTSAPAGIAPLVVPEKLPAATSVARRDHEPPTNLKRSDPFQFGSRYLTREDDVFEFNAWDHVETDDAFKEYAEQQYEMQRQSPVSDFDKNRYNSDPAKWWNVFYKNNTANFFKDRKWLASEFPVLTEFTRADAGPRVIVEIGAGAGNTAFPILLGNENPHLRLHACDFSKTAVGVMRAHESYDPAIVRADVWDVAGAELPPGVEEGSVDLVLMIFVFSALSPAEWGRAVGNVHRMLRPGGRVCFRDYGRGDLAQVRFRKGRYLEDNFYVRGDGTRVYFFEVDELRRVWGGGGGGATAGPADSANSEDEADGAVAEAGEADAEAGEADAGAGEADEADCAGSADPPDSANPPDPMLPLDPANPPNPANPPDSVDSSDSTNPPDSASSPDSAAKRAVDCPPHAKLRIDKLGVDRRLLVNRARRITMHRCWIQGLFTKEAE